VILNRDDLVSEKRNKPNRPTGYTLVSEKVIFTAEDDEVG